MTNTEQQSRLDKGQNLNFDKSYINQEEFQTISDHIESQYGSQERTLIADFGGGNGQFCDLLLRQHPNAELYNIDLSKDLLDLNIRSDRKHLVNSSFYDFQLDTKLDVACMNYVLHHLVSSTRSGSVSLIDRAFGHAHAALSKDGSLIIFENILVSRVNEKISSAILYWGSSSKLISRITKFLGVNTAGVGIYYMGELELLELADRNGFNLESSFVFRPPYRSLIYNVFFSKEIMRKGFVFSRVERHAPPCQTVQQT